MKYLYCKKDRNIRGMLLTAALCFVLAGTGAAAENPGQQTDGKADAADYSVYAPVAADYLNQYGEYTQYAQYDIDGNGVEELIISYGTCSADWANDVYTIRNGESFYTGMFYSMCTLYEAEDGNGLYAAYGKQLYQVVTQVTLNGSALNTKEIISGEIAPTDEYYTNDHPVEWKDAAKYPGVSSGYLINGSDSRYITEEDLAGMDSSTLELARNEIYARHGRRFKKEYIQQYFDQQAWYSGTVDPEDFSDSVFNEYERANIDFIVAYENSGGAGDKEWYYAYTWFVGAKGKTLEMVVQDDIFLTGAFDGVMAVFALHMEPDAQGDDGQQIYTDGEFTLEYYPNDHHVHIQGYQDPYYDGDYWPQ